MRDIVAMLQVWVAKFEKWLATLVVWMALYKGLGLSLRERLLLQVVLCSHNSLCKKMYNKGPPPLCLGLPIK